MKTEHIVILGLLAYLLLKKTPTPPAQPQPQPQPQPEPVESGSGGGGGGGYSDNYARYGDIPLPYGFVIPSGFAKKGYTPDFVAKQVPDMSGKGLGMVKKNDSAPAPKTNPMPLPTGMAGRRVSPAAGGRKK